MVFFDDTTLEHAGVKGMRWGVRKGLYSADGSRKLSGSEAKAARADAKTTAQKAKHQAYIKKRNALGQSKIARFGGSKPKAIAFSLGKWLLKDIGSSAAYNVTANLAAKGVNESNVYGRTVISGVGAMATIGFKTTALVTTVREINAIARAPELQD